MIKKKFRVIRGSEHRFVNKHALFPLGTTCLLVRCPYLWEVCVKYSSKWPILLPQHLGAMPWHQARFHVFLIIFEFKSHGSQCLCPSRDTNMFENSFQFTAQDINLHTRTQIWFFNPWWFAFACTCSSNLNYNHYMARNSLNALKRSNDP